MLDIKTQIKCKHDLGENKCYMFAIKKCENCGQYDNDFQKQLASGFSSIIEIMKNYK